MVRTRWAAALLLTAAALLWGCSRTGPSVLPAAGGRAAGAGPQETLAVPAIVATGGAIHGASGIAFDAAGRLHVASVIGNEIVVLDAETGEVVSTIGVNAGVVGPDDIAFGPDGSLYWTSFSTGDVGRITPEGERSTLAVRPGVNGIAFSPDGRLFVTVVFMGDALYEIDPALAGPPRLVAEDLGFLNGIAWGPDGLVYGPSWSRGRIVKVDVESGLAIPVALGFSVPAAVEFDSAGRIYVVEHATGRVRRLDPAAGTDQVIATLPPGLDNLAFGAGDRLFVSHGQDGAVYEVLPGGAIRTVLAGGMIAPGGVAAVAGPEGETVWVADFWTLRGFDAASGRETACLRHLMGARGGIECPFSVAADGRNLIVTSWLHRGVVQVVDPADGSVLEEYVDFAEPLSAVRFQGDLVVAERGTGSVVRISSAEPHERSVVAGGLAVPAGLATDGSNLWVTDWAAGTLLQIASGGQAMPRPVRVATALDYPEGIAVEADGDLLVVEPERGRLSRVNPATGEVTALVECLAPCLQDDHPTWVFNGVAVGPSGTVYLTNDVSNTLCSIPAGR